jgi:hypothetical protein
MNQNAKTILILLEQYLEENPSIRFAQALFNLGITEFADKDNPSAKQFTLRDIYNDTDDSVMERITKQTNLQNQTTS